MHVHKVSKSFLIRGHHYAIFAFILSAMVVAVNHSWEFNPYGWVDHWAYFGNEHFPLALRRNFPTEPSGDLLPVIWPVYVLNHVFAPVVAQYVHAWLYLGITTWLIMLIVGKRYSTNISLSIGAMFIGSQYALTSLGTNYPAGSVMMYLTASIYFLQKSNIQIYSLKNIFKISFLGAIFYSLAFYSAILVTIYFPALLIFLYLEYRSVAFQEKFKFVMVVTLGFLTAFLTVTTLLEVLYLRYGQGYFFKNNFSKLFGFTAGNDYRAPAFSTWLPYASWLILPSIIVIVIVLYFILQLLQKNIYFQKQDLGLQTLPVAIFASLVCTNLFVHQWSLQFMYFIQTQSVFFIGLAGLFGVLDNKWHLFRSIRIPLYIFSASIISLFVANTHDYNFQTLETAVLNFLNLNSSHPLRFLAFYIISITILYFLATQRKYLTLIGVGLLVATNIFSFSPTFGCFACFNAYASKGAFAGIASSEDNFLQSVKLSDAIAEIDPTRGAKIWFNELTPLGPLFRQVNAIVYLNQGTHRISKSFPAPSDTSDPIGSGGSPLNPNDKILILSQNSQDDEAAKKVFVRLHEKFTLKSTTQIHLSGQITAFIFYFEPQ